MFAGLHDRLLLRPLQFSDDRMILLRMRLTQQLGYLPIGLTEAVGVVMFAEGVLDLFPDFCGHIAAQLHAGGV